jgi:hypothetical protein
MIEQGVSEETTYSHRHGTVSITSLTKEEIFTRLASIIACVGRVRNDFITLTDSLMGPALDLAKDKTREVGMSIDDIIYWAEEECYDIEEKIAKVVRDLSGK